MAQPSIDGRPLKPSPPKESGTVWIGPEKAMAERISALEAERDALLNLLEEWRAPGEASDGLKRRTDRALEYHP